MSEKSENFEEALLKLEKVVKNLESGNLSIEEALTSFQEGVGLVKNCQNYLAKVDQKIEILTKANAEAIETKKFEND